MKKFMLRGYQNKAIANYMPKSLKYNTWYDFVTPFDWQFFKIKKGSRFVSVYDDIDDLKPKYTFSRKRFLEKILMVCKSRPTEVLDENYPHKDLLKRNYL